MKKIIFFLSLLLLVSTPILAVNKKTGIQEVNLQQQSRTEAQEEMVSPIPTGKTIQIQNQIRIQNEEEDSQIQTQTQEQKESKEASVAPKNKGQEEIKVLNPRSETARQHISDVAAKVEEILTTQTAKGGIGEQVRQIAQEQKTAQQQTQTNLEKVDKRQGWLKLIIGPDLKAIKNIERVIKENQLRIQKLTELKNQLTNQGEITQLEEMIQALVNQNTALQERINLEEKTGSLFGWLFRLFVK